MPERFKVKIETYTITAINIPYVVYLKKCQVIKHYFRSLSKSNEFYRNKLDETKTKDVFEV